MNTQVGVVDIIRITPLIILFLLSLVPITVKVLRGNREQAPVATLIQGLLGIGLSFLTLVFIVGSPKETAFLNALVFDGVTLWVGGAALVGAAMSVMLMYDNLSTNGEQFSELMFLTLSSVLGMLILVAAADLLTVFIGLETMSLALYLMIGMSHEQKLSKEAALKYFILGALASAIFLYGVSFIYGTVGSTFIPAIIEATDSLADSNRMFLFGMALVIIGFCFKVSIVPFHAWTPDVYQGAPTPHTAYMSTAIKAVSFAALLRIIETKTLVKSENLFVLLQWLAVITMIVGNVAAIIQNNLKRVLAYSSVAHSGYLLVGIITSGHSDQVIFGASGVIFYLISYTLMTIGAFAVVSYVEKNENHSIQVEDLAGYAKKKPAVAFALTLFLLSLAGVPPTVGFFGKFYLFTSAIGEGLLWLAIWGVLNSVISVYYYLRPIVMMYMKDGSAELSEESRIPTMITIGTAAVLVVLFGIISGPIYSLIEKALS